MKGGGEGGWGQAKEGKKCVSVRLVILFTTMVMSYNWTFMRYFGRSWLSFLRPFMRIFKFSFSYRKTWRIKWFLSHLLVAGCDIGVRFSVRPSVRPSVSPSVRPSVRLLTFMSKFDIYVKVSILINYKTKQPSNLAWNISLTSWLRDIGVRFFVRLSVRPSVCQHLCRSSTFMSKLVFWSTTRLNNHQTLYETSPWPPDFAT